MPLVHFKASAEDFSDVSKKVYKDILEQLEISLGYLLDKSLRPSRIEGRVPDYDAAWASDEILPDAQELIDKGLAFIAEGLTDTMLENEGQEE